MSSNKTHRADLVPAAFTGGSENTLIIDSEAEGGGSVSLLETERSW